MGPTAAEMAWLVAVAAKAAAVLGCAGFVASLPGRSAAGRHHAWALGVAGALLIPVLSWSLPAMPVPVPAMPASALPFVEGVGGADPVEAPNWPLGLAAVWAVGSVGVGLRVAGAHLAAWRLARGSVRVTDGPCRVALAEAAIALRASGRVDLRRSGLVESPMTLGVLRPRILVPSDADHWPPDRLRAVLVHELGHVTRRDALVQLAAQLACVAYWWNPMAWLAARRLRVEREHACDDLVIGAGTLPSSYAADLLVVARALSSRAALGVVPIAAVDPSGTEARLRRILDPKVPRRRPPVGVRLVGAGVALVLAATLARSSALAEVAPRPEVPPPVCGRPGSEDPDAADVEGLGDLDACFPPGESGDLVVHWTVDLSGRTRDVCVTRDDVGDPAVVDCVNRRVEEGTFPDLRGRTVEITLPSRR